MWSLQDSGVINPPWIKKTIKLRLTDIIKQEWSTEMWNNSSCSVYRIFKEDLCVESYLNKLSSMDTVSIGWPDSETPNYQSAKEALRPKMILTNNVRHVTMVTVEN